MHRRADRKLDMETRFAFAKRKNMVSGSAGIHSCILVLDGLKPDFNIGKIFRSADAFSAREIHLVGIDFFDPEPAKGSVRWVQFFQHENFAACYNSLDRDNYTLITLEPGQDRSLGREPLPEKVAFILGHEEFGLSFDRNDYPKISSLSIPQWGHVQSLNVSVAASIVLYEYARQHGEPLDRGMVQASVENMTR